MVIIMPQNTTIAAIATPPGQGGIAVVRLSGPESYDVASQVFVPKNTQKNVKDNPAQMALYGHFIHRGKVIDDGMMLGFRAPASYTGEDVVEFSCHGSEVVSGMLLSACIECGAAPAGPGEFTRRAFLNGRISLTQAEAVMDLVASSSRQAAAAAESALEGALYRKIQEIEESLVTLAGHLAACVDFPEEDVEELTAQEFARVSRQARAELAALVENYDRGMVIKRGVRAAIVGSPNVGKSTLFNVMSGFERAIVTPVAGTTRDVVREQIQVGGIQLLLSDTAGLHQTEDVVEAEGIRRSEAEMEQAALLIAVYDGSQPLDVAGRALAESCAGKPAVAVINKSDLGTMIDVAELLPWFAEAVVVSANERDTAETIEQAILRLLKLNDMDTDAAMLANQRQLRAAEAALMALDDADAALMAGYTLDAAGVCLEDALSALKELSGENVAEAVIDEVFSAFCVGK
ncbi:MAG: tRNA uridine-5-carboxymethylaminomethyl(34) synthesis GTPase MnmE [Ruminococcaceae bacterium]|nr:tRNA uridine-5-carboxymethylaminomethyl(34) synthesis GTPase MnmE [Oscillospiraceae bacterium]